MPEPRKPKTAGLGTKKEFAIYLGIIIAIGVSLFYLLRDTNQTLAATIFLPLFSAPSCSGNLE